MSKIIDNVSLAVGLITSTAVLNANNVRFHIETSNIVDNSKEIKVTLKVKDGGNNYALLADDQNNAIVISMRGNGIKSRNVFGINSASLIAEVVNKVGLVGNISIWTNEN